MKPSVSLTTVSILTILFLSSASTGVVLADDDRFASMDRELNCVSNHVKSGVAWNDICYTSSESSAKNRIVAKSMDQMINERTADADEWSGGRTVDTVAKEQGEFANGSRTVDDFMAEQGVENGFAPTEAAPVVNETMPVENTEQDALDSTQTQEPQYKQYAQNNSRRSYQPADMTPQGSLSSPSRPLTDRLDNQNKSEIGFEYNRQRYVEPIFDLVEKGALYGAYVAYTARPGKNDTLYDDIIDMYKADMRFSYGRMDYQSAGSGKIDDIPDWTFEARILAGKDLQVLSDSRLTPYMGFGYRYLNDDSSGKLSTVGASGYERESRYLYVPIGVEFTTRLTEGWLVSPTLEYDVFVSGTQISRLSDVNGGFPDIKNKQRSGFGMRGSVKFVKEGNPVNLVIEPYIRYWHIEDSDETTAAGPAFIVTGLEPENKTTEYGVRLGAEF